VMQLRLVGQRRELASIVTAEVPFSGRLYKLLPLTLRASTRQPASASDRPGSNW
jgi:hypothetical protein